jgi:protein SCO1/2
MRLARFAGIVALFFALAGCSGGPSGRPAATEKEYEVRGKVVSVDAKKPAVTLDHEDIPGVMKAMTMEFPVADAKLLEGLHDGDQVQGRLKKTESGYLITHLEKR